MTFDATKYLKTQADLLQRDLISGHEERRGGALWRIRRALAKPRHMSDDQVVATFRHSNALEVIASEQHFGSWDELRRKWRKSGQAEMTLHEIIMEVRDRAAEIGNAEEAAWAIVEERKPNLEWLALALYPTSTGAMLYDTFRRLSDTDQDDVFFAAATERLADLARQDAGTVVMYGPVRAGAISVGDWIATDVTDQVLEALGDGKNAILHMVRGTTYTVPREALVERVAPRPLD